MPLKWKPANHDLSSRRSPTINGMKSAPPRTCASSSLVESCCCNFARVWLLPLLGQPNRVRRHDFFLAKGRWDTWQVPSPNLIRSKHLPLTNRGCPSARAQIDPNTWSTAPAPTTLRKAAAHSDCGVAGHNQPQKTKVYKNNYRSRNINVSDHQNSSDQTISIR